MVRVIGDDADGIAVVNDDELEGTTILGEADVLHLPLFDDVKELIIVPPGALGEVQGWLGLGGGQHGRLGLCGGLYLDGRGLGEGT